MRIKKKSPFLAFLLLAALGTFAGFYWNYQRVLLANVTPLPVTHKPFIPPKPQTQEETQKEIDTLLQQWDSRPTRERMDDLKIIMNRNTDTIWKKGEAESDQAKVGTTHEMRLELHKIIQAEFKLRMKYFEDGLQPIPQLLRCLEQHLEASLAVALTRQDKQKVYERMIETATHIVESLESRIKQRLATRLDLHEAKTLELNFRIQQENHNSPASNKLIR